MRKSLVTLSADMHSYRADSDEGRSGQTEGCRDGEWRGTPEIYPLRDGGQQWNTNRLLLSGAVMELDNQACPPPPPPHSSQPDQPPKRNAY